MENNTTIIAERENAVAVTAENAVSTFSFKNPELNRATLELLRTVQSERKNTMERAKILHEIYTRKLYVEDGIKNIEVYAKKYFNWGKAYTYQLINAYKKFGNAPLLLSDGKEAEFTVGHYQEFATISRDKAQELLEKGLINPDMTTAEVREVVKNLEAENGEEKPKKEKVFMWAPVTAKKNMPETKATQSEIIEKAKSDGWVFAERITAENEAYIVGILNGAPVMYKRMDEVKVEKTDKSKK